MKTTRTAQPWPDEIKKLFPDTHTFEQFAVEWNEIVARRRKGWTMTLRGRRTAGPQALVVEVVAGVLMQATATARAARSVHTTVNRSDFSERAARIRKLLEDLREEITHLYDPERTRPLFAAAIRRMAVEEDLHLTLQESRRAAARRAWTLRALTDATTPVWRAWSQLVESLGDVVAALAGPLRRPRGHQPQPWLAPAMRDLRSIGLTKQEADDLLHIVGLKGAEPDTISR